MRNGRKMNEKDKLDGNSLPDLITTDYYQRIYTTIVIGGKHNINLI